MLNNMFDNSTRKMIFMFSATLCVLTAYTMIYYPDTLFEKVLTYFMGVFSTYIGIKGGSSLPEGAKPSVQNVEKEKSNIDPSNI